MQGVDGEDAPRDIDLFEQGADGGDLPALLIEAEGGHRQSGRMLDQGGGLEVPVSVAVGAANALAIHRNCAAQLQSRHRETPEHGLDLLGIHRGDHPVQGGLRDRDVAAGPGVLPGADRLEFRLRKLLRILGGDDGPAQICQPRENVHGEHRRDGMLAPLGAPKVPDLGQLLIQRAQLARRLLARALGLPLGGQRARIAQAPAGVPPQGVHIQPLGLAVRIGIAAVVTRKPPGVAEITPVPGAVEGAVEVGRVDETLGDQHRVSIVRLPILTETPQHPGQRPRAESREDPLGGENHEPCIVRDQMQTPVLQVWLPSDPAVPMPALEGARLPAGERQPLPAPFDDVAQTATGKPFEAEVMVLVNPSVPLHPLVGAGQSHLGIVEEKPFRGFLEDHFVVCWSAHTPRMKPGAKKSQRRMQTSAVVGANRQIFLAWDGPAARRGCPTAELRGRNKTEFIYHFPQGLLRVRSSLLYFGCDGGNGLVGWEEPHFGEHWVSIYTDFLGFTMTLFHGSAYSGRYQS